MKDQRTYEVLENYTDLFYLNNHLEWFKDLLITETCNYAKEHLNICINICNRKLKGSYYEVAK